MCNLNAMVEISTGLEITSVARWSDMSPGYLGGLMVEVPPPRKKPSTTTESQ